MRSGKIHRAYDTITPTPDQKDRMLGNIKSAMRGERSRYRERPVRDNWLPVLGAAVMLAVVMGISIFYLQSLNTEPDPLDEVVTTEPSTPDYTGEADIIKAIQDIKSLYLKAVAEGWDMETCQNAGISLLTAHCTSTDQLGYALLDIDGNGTEELIISDGNVIFDLYSFENGESVHVISGGERNSYTLCEGNFISNIASGGAANTVYTFYELHGTDFIWYEKVIYDGSDEEGPWFTSHIAVSMTRIAVDEATALSIIDSYQMVPIEIEPLG